jgi:hypothetical protein
MMSLEVMWTFLRKPCVTTLVGDSYAMGPGGERLEVWESRVGEGRECENLRDQNPETPKPQNPKTQSFVWRAL